MPPIVRTCSELLNSSRARSTFTCALVGTARTWRASRRRGGGGVDGAVAAAGWGRPRLVGICLIRRLGGHGVAAVRLEVVLEDGRLLGAACGHGSASRRLRIRPNSERRSCGLRVEAGMSMCADSRIQPSL